MKLRKKNEDGKYIVKDIPENLVPTYEQIGWKKVVVGNNFKTKITNASTNSNKNIPNNKIKNDD